MTTGTTDDQLPTMHDKWRAVAFLRVAFFLQQGTRQIFGAPLTSVQSSLGAFYLAGAVIIAVARARRSRT